MNIALIGFMGTGKSVVGKLIAEKLGWRFVDLDAMIEREIGMRIADIFARRGEPYFRNLESKAVGLVSLLDETVISCGGGVVLDPANMTALEKKGIVVCLTATPEKILERTKGDNRPLLNVKDPLAKIKELLDARKQFYRRCHLTVDTSELGPEDVAEGILSDPLIAAKLGR